jgi:hypothetical protein
MEPAATSDYWFQLRSIGPAENATRKEHERFGLLLTGRLEVSKKFW